MNLISTFQERSKDWEEQLGRNEWFFAELREEIVSPLSPPEAFALLSQAALLMLSQDEEYLCIETTELLLSLARKADTTEMPNELSDKWEALISQISRFGDYGRRQAQTLCEWYRK